MFEANKLFLLFYFEQNEVTLKLFINGLYKFLGEKYDIAVKWLMKKRKQFFHEKAIIYIHLATFLMVYVIVETLIGETTCNVEERWSRYVSVNNKSSC